MAGDWIKMRIDLPDDPDVVTIARLTGLDPDAVVGKLLRFWGWASRHSADGYVSVTLMYVSSMLCAPKFAEALVKVGWLEAPAGARKARIRIPKWDRHLSQSAKERGLTQMRVARHRQRSCNDCRVTKALPEKRRKDKTPPPPRGEGAGGELRARARAELRRQLDVEGALPPEEVRAALARAAAKSGAEEGGR